MIEPVYDGVADIELFVDRQAADGLVVLKVAGVRIVEEMVGILCLYAPPVLEVTI